MDLFVPLLDELAWPRELTTAVVIESSQSGASFLWARDASVSATCKASAAVKFITQFEAQF